MQIGINLIKIKRKFNIGFPLRNRNQVVHSLRMTISLVHETLAFTHAHNNLQVVAPLMDIETAIDV